MYFGADYYPEEWPRQRWHEDAHLMADAGFNVVRLGELAWALLEPEPGRYDFSWLDDAVALLHEHGISTIMGTPTTTAPPWMLDLDPDVLRVDENGQRMVYGSWGNFCLNSPAFRLRSAIIARAMARHYGGNEAVIAWQIDNEFGVFDRARCYCERCAEAFRKWLRERYGSLAALNKAWGTSFWSHIYTRWEQIPIPRRTHTKHNPGLLLDYARFCSETTRSYLQLQAGVVREEAPRQPLTHNFLAAAYTHLDLFALAAELDVAGWDNYVPNARWVDAALSHELFRSLKRQPFWVLEQQCSYPQWPPYANLERGLARLLTYQGVAHGADGILYFRWRTGLIGAEQYHAGILPHGGRPGRVYEEIRTIGQELRQLEPLLAGALPRAQVACIVDYDSLWALEFQPHNDSLGDPWSYHRPWYRALRLQHLACDFVQPAGDLSLYRLIIAPALAVVSEEAVRNLRSFVENGGVLVLTVRSGSKDVHSRMVDKPLPGLLAPLAGATVREFDSRPAGAEVAIRFTAEEWAEGEARAALWFELLEPEGASVVARYGSGLYEGGAAVTWQPVGRGGVLYVGCLGDEVSERLLPALLRRSGVRAPVAIAAPEQVEVAIREGPAGRAVFLLNHSDAAREAHLQGPGEDALTGERLNGEVVLGPYGVRVLRM